MQLLESIGIIIRERVNIERRYFVQYQLLAAILAVYVSVVHITLKQC